MSSQEEYQFNERQFQTFAQEVHFRARNSWYEGDHCGCMGDYRDIELWFMSDNSLATTDMILADWRKIDRINHFPQIHSFEDIYDIFVWAHLGEEQIELHWVREFFGQDDGVLQDELIELCQPHLLERWGTPCQCHMKFVGFRENNGRIIFNRELFDRRHGD